MYFLFWNYGIGVLLGYIEIYLIAYLYILVI